MKRIIISTAFTIALIFGISLTLKAQNLVVNPGMEAWTGGAPDGWIKAENITQENTIIHEGSSSAKHTSETTTKDLQQDITGILEGSEYTISYWFLDNDTEARTRIWSYWLSGGATLPDNAEELRPSTYSEDNPDWQEFNVVLTAPAGADAFRFEVRVYKQDNVPGGSVYYDEFVFSGDITVDPEPSNYPTAFEAEALGSAISLAWTDAIGTQLPSAYLIYAGTNSSLPVPVDGTPVANDPDLSDGSGALNVNFGIESASFSDLDPSTTYYFSIYPYTNNGSSIDFKTDGTAPTAEATTSNNVTIVIEYENFDDDWGNWTTVSVIGDQVWDRDNTYGIGGTPCAAMSGYDVQPYDNEDWLISPAMNFNDYENESMNFSSAMNYSGPDLELKASTDYSGSGDPNAATWTDLTFNMPPGGNWDWIESGIVDLSSFSGASVYVAFKFTSTTAGSATWELDEITINGEEEATIDPEPSNYPTGFTAMAAGSAIDLSWTDATGSQLPDAYIIYAGTSSSLPTPVDGTTVADDIDLSDGNGAINITYGEEEYTFEGLDPATTYYFSIYPYTNSGVNIDFKTDGTAPTAEATTSAGATVIEYENFDESWGNWTTISVVGDQVWDRDNTYGINSTPCAQMSGYDGAPFDNEDWLISPFMNFDDYDNESMNFFSAMNYTGPDLELKASTDYTGSGDPNAATWSDLTFNMPPGGNWDFVESGIVDLSSFSGTSVYVAFKFTSTTAGSATWELDEITINGEENSGPSPEPSNYPTDFDAVPSNTSISLNWTDATGAQLPDAYIIYAGTSDALPSPVDGTPVPDDLDLSDGSGAYNVSYGTETTIFDNLDLNTTYYFSIYSYTNSGVNIDFKTDGTAPTVETTTLLIPEPTNYPTDFSTFAGFSFINLEWTDATGSQLPEAYVILAGNSSTLPAPEDGTPISDDPDLSDGSAVMNINFGIEEFSFDGLNQGMTYYFAIYPYTNSGSDINYKNDGTAPTAEATTQVSSSTIIEEENFDDSWGNWTTVSVIGDQVWDRDNTWGIGDTPCASITGYDGQPYENDDWLISPALNLDNYTNELIVFQNALGYNGEDLKLKISTNYDGGGDPYSATWSEELFTMSSGFFEWTESGEIDLSGYEGNAVYIAFQFISTDSESATWEIDDISITGNLDIGTGEITEQDDMITVYPNPAADYVYVSQNHYTNVSIQSLTGNLVKEIQLNSQSSRLDISSLKTGVYIMLFYNENNGNKQSRKLLVK